jgi:uncharacterized coiled-coil DUF342 family protein
LTQNASSLISRTPMSMNSSTREKIQELQAQIAALQEEEVKELKQQRNQLLEQVQALDSQIAAITGKSTLKKGAGPEKKSTGRSIPLQELKDLLAAAPEKTLNIRKEGLQLSNIRTLANVNPHLLQMGGKGAWPTVTLLK